MLADAMIDTLYEVHVDEGDETGWRTASRFDVLEEARIEAVHLIRHTEAQRVRVIHVVEYYAKTGSGFATHGSRKASD
jgi:hypothetical protein